jgi:hypothetical protein
MGKKNRQSVGHRIHSGAQLVRPSATGLVSHARYVVPRPDGSFEIERTHLKRPTNEYADCAWVARRLGGVSLFFAKADLNAEGKFRSRLELRYPEEQFRAHLWQNSRDFHEHLRVRSVPAPEDLIANPEKVPSEKDHSVWVNIEFISQSGSEVQLDFFHMPPERVYMARQGQGGLELDPVVRVLTTAPVVKHLLDQVDVIAKQVEESAKRWVEPKP